MIGKSVCHQEVARLSSAISLSYSHFGQVVHTCGLLSSSSIIYAHDKESLVYSWDGKHWPEVNNGSLPTNIARWLIPTPAQIHV